MAGEIDNPYTKPVATLLQEALAVKKVLNEKGWNPFGLGYSNEGGISLRAALSDACGYRAFSWYPLDATMMIVGKREGLLSAWELEKGRTAQDVMALVARTITFLENMQEEDSNAT